MKIFSIVIMAAVMVFMPVDASAQKLGNLLKKAASSDVVNSVINTYVPGANAVSLPGSWSYTGAAVSLSGETAVSNIAGTAVTSGIENKIDGYLQKIGVKPGAVHFTFNGDKTFISTIFGINLSGTWQINDEAKRVTLQYGKVMKYLSMTGTLTRTSEGCEILFDADRFLTFIKSALSFAGKGSTAASGLSSLTSSYKGMKLGYKLAKQ